MIKERYYYYYCCCVFSRFCYQASSWLHAAFDFNSVDGVLIWT